MGIRGMLWRWVHQFLQNRTVRVVDNIIASDYHNISAGVPQGSVLSQLLFTIYVNDIYTVIPRTMTIRLYADDIQLNPTKLKGIREAELMNSTLNNITQWANINLITFGQDKSNIMLVSRCKHPIHPQ